MGNKALHSFEEIKDWIDSRNKLTHVDIKKIKLNEMSNWFYDVETGEIRNKNRSFFTITGIRETVGNKTVEQPIIIQDEIGYLGFIRKTFNGTMHYLIQAKIEPGNVNCVQLSPTIQATKSNFTQAHGGAVPKYLEYFTSKSYKVVYDQLQSEQNSRFFAKRNRNVIIELSDSDAIEVLPNFMWATLEQIQELMKINNLVNMDTRTVLSGLITQLPVLQAPEELQGIYTYMNDYKMLIAPKRELIPLDQVKGWHFTDSEFVADDEDKANFKVIFADISIEGREVTNWQQPLFEAKGKATFGLVIRNIGEIGIEILVRVTPEIGTMDYIELGPTIQLEANEKPRSSIEKKFFQLLETKKPEVDVILSEEGGRFYHEENRNIVFELANVDELQEEGYFWLTLKELSELMLINNCLNIQLRNLISLLGRLK